MARKIFLLLLVAISLISLKLSSAPAALSQNSGQQLKIVVIEADNPGQVKKLAAMGLDIAAVRQGPDKEGPRGLSGPSFRVEAVVSARETKKLSDEGFSWSDAPGQGPAKKIGEPYDVYHSFDEPVTGIRAELQQIGSTYPQLTQIRSIGRTVQGRPIPAMRLTNEQNGNDKAEVMFMATAHAREWVATQMAMRLIKYLTSNYGADARVTNLLDNTEIWIIPVANPDGYQYTFTNERLWRKNLRDNDGDGQITLADGVDLNRNFDSHWGYDDEGSSPSWPDATYRGPAPESEPETQAVVNFIKQHDFKFAVSYHTYGNLLLYPWGWQVKTPSLDDPIFVAQAGTDANPAVWDSLLDVGYDPGVGADLYITNGEFTDWAYGEMGIPAYTPELTYGCSTVACNPEDSILYDFRFPDNEEMVQQVFEDNLEFALSLAESATDPAHPVSPVGISTEDIYHTPVTDSYGSDQIIEVLARKGLNLSLSYNLNGGPAQMASFSEKLGALYNDQSGLYYSKYEAVISGQQAGTSADYQINGDVNVGPYSYSVTSASGNPILVVAAEDYSGGAPTYHPGNKSHYLDYYTDALDAGGYAYDVWDVDKQGIPSYAEVLSHYQVVIWYTGDDYAAFVPNGLDTQEAEVLNFREFMNYESGKLFATGQDLAWLAAVYGYYSDDFFQYYLGANMHIEEGGMNPATGLPYDIIGQAGDPIFDGLAFSLQGKEGANNQHYADTFLPTGHFLPHFNTALAARYNRPGGPFDPHSGDYYVYSQMADSAYKRLGGTFNIPAGATLKFWVSYDIEVNWDYAFVEVSEVGSGVWKTLPDLNGLTTTNTGESCPEGWVDQIHPFLANYMDPATCAAIAWNGFTGNSGGWQQVEMDLSPYAGKQVELYISYASDWAVQNLGVFVDDIELSGYPLEDFEAGLGVWSISAGPGNAPFNNWARITGAGFPEGPAIRTPNTVYLGFGFEAIDTEANRNAVMDRVMQYLGQ